MHYIQNTLRFGSKPGLERIAYLLGLMGNPQDDLSFIHIAGTNGKGSVANAISAALTQSGVKTGLYISPYVVDFCERIQIDGQMILHDELAEQVARIQPFVQKAAQNGEQPTEFEIITALAFDYFKRQGCGVVVLEVGLGGRFDATNIINKPLVSVITPISLDHTEILGDTVAKIAFEKCGIIKPGGVTVSSPAQPPEALEVIMRTCAERGNTLVLPSLSSVKILNEGIDGTDIRYGHTALHIPLIGRHQIGNFITAYEAVKALARYGFKTDDDVIVRGMETVRFAARLEVLHKNPLVLLDGAHNPSGAAVLADAVGLFLPQKPVVVMGMLADKDFGAAIAKIAPLAKAFIAVKPDSPRALNPEETAKAARLYCEKVTQADDYKEAFKKALALADGGPVMICGSLYLAGGMRQAVLDIFPS